MKAGERDKRVTFFSPIEVQNGSGGTEEGWVKEFTRWTGVLNLRGGEEVQAARLEAKRPVIFTVLYDSGTEQIGPDWKAEFDGMEFNIREFPVLSDNRLNLEFRADGNVKAGR